MKRYPSFAALGLSFFSKPLYQDVGRNWRGVGFGYLLLLLAIAWIPTLVQMQWGLSRFVNHRAGGIVQQIPRLTIKNGTLSTDVATPYFIKDPEGGKIVAIIDLTGKYDSLEGTDAAILLTQNRLFAKPSGSETRVYDLSTVKDFWLDSNRVEGWLRIFGTWLAPILYPFCVVGSYAYRIVQALIYGLLGLLFANIVGVSLSYPTAVRLAVVSITPVVIIDEIRSLTSLRIPYWWLICFIMAMGYLLFAVNANKELATAAPQQPPAIS